MLTVRCNWTNPISKMCLLFSIFTGRIEDMYYTSDRRMDIFCIFAEHISTTSSVWCGFDRALSIIYGNNMPTRCNRWIFIADIIACSTCFGDHYAHHQELESIIQVVAACRIWCLVFKLSVWCGAEGSASHHTDNLKTKHQIRQAAPTCIILSSSWWWS